MHSLFLHGSSAVCIPYFFTVQVLYAFLISSRFKSCMHSLFLHGSSAVCIPYFFTVLVLYAFLISSRFKCCMHSLFLHGSSPVCIPYFFHKRYNPRQLRPPWVVHSDIPTWRHEATDTIFNYSITRTLYNIFALTVITPTWVHRNHRLTEREACGFVWVYFIKQQILRTNHDGG
jgi:hypothetical protein